MSKRRNRAIRNVSEKVTEVKETVETKVDETKPETVKTAENVKNVETDVYVQYGPLEVKAKDVVEKVKNVYKESGKNIDDINTLKVYIKPEDNAAYYVINDEENGKVEL